MVLFDIFRSYFSFNSFLLFCCVSVLCEVNSQRLLQFSFLSLCDAVTDSLQQYRAGTRIEATSQGGEVCFICNKVANDTGRQRLQTSTLMYTNQHTTDAN